ALPDQMLRLRRQRTNHAQQVAPANQSLEVHQLDSQALTCDCFRADEGICGQVYHLKRLDQRKELATDVPQAYRAQHLPRQSVSLDVEFVLPPSLSYEAVLAQ